MAILFNQNNKQTSSKSNINISNNAIGNNGVEPSRRMFVLRAEKKVRKHSGHNSSQDINLDEHNLVCLPV